MPINVISSHWFLAVLDLNTWKVTVYDSQTSSNMFQVFNEKGHFKSVGQSILSELDDIDYWDDFPAGHRPEMIEFVEAENVPQQEADTGDCGVFTCLFMELLASGLPVQTHSSSREVGVSYRRRMLDILWATVM